VLQCVCLYTWLAVHTARVEDRDRFRVSNGVMIRFILSIRELQFIIQLAVCFPLHHYIGHWLVVNVNNGFI